MRNAVRVCLLVLVAVLLTGTGAIGQGSYPGKPITLVTHSSVGAGGACGFDAAAQRAGRFHCPPAVAVRSMAGAACAGFGVGML